MKKTKLFLVLIILLATFLRFWQIDKYPAGFNADEAAYAYNAYSLIETGKDEFGNSWPVHLVSFADYKPAGTTYLMMPFIKLFGLEQTVARLPGILAGIISVLLMFLLVRKLFGITSLALIAALFLAISPWHLHFSRGAWETNIATTFLLAGTYFFLKAVEKPKYYYWWVIFYAAALYTYHTPRVVAPLLALFLLIYYQRQVRRDLKVFLKAIVLGVLVMTPFLISFTGPAVSARFSGVSVFSDIGPFWQVNRSRGEHEQPNSLVAKMFHNRPLIYVEKISQNWLSHYDGTYLFINGDPIKRSNAPATGEMYYFDLPLILLGIYFFIKNKPKNAPAVFTWLLLAPIAASFTFQSPNALRAHNLVIPLVIISAYGFYQLLLIIKSERFLKWRKIIYGILLLIMVWNVTYYLHQYFVHYPKTYPEAWEYGIKDLVNYLEPEKGKYRKIFVTEKYDQPYIIFLFYLAYPPAKFQQEAVLTARDKFGFSTVRDLDNYHFENINWERLRGENDALICGTDQEIPDDANIVKTINFLNGKPAFQCAVSYGKTINRSGNL